MTSLQEPVCRQPHEVQQEAGTRRPPADDWDGKDGVGIVWGLVLSVPLWVLIAGISYYAWQVFK